MSCLTANRAFKAHSPLSHLLDAERTAGILCANAHVSNGCYPHSCNTRLRDPEWPLNFDSGR